MHDDQGGVLQNQDLSTLIAMISDLQKTIALLTSRLARYEKQDLEKELSVNNSASNSTSTLNADRYQGRSHDPRKDRNNGRGNNYQGKSYDPKKDRQNVAYHKARKGSIEELPSNSSSSKCT